MFGRRNVMPMERHVYAPPEEPPSTFCTDTSDSKPPRAYYTTSTLPTILEGDEGTMNPDKWWMETRRGVPEVFISFEKQAPTEWELVRWGAGWIWSNTLEQVPPRLAADSGICEGKGYFNDGVSEGCSTRELPAAWASSCPLVAGNTVPAWWLAGSNSEGSTGELIKRQHGCYANSTNAITTPMEGAPADPPELTVKWSQRFSELAGVGPPNPDCMTITPPSWRTKDYFVNVKHVQANGFNPIALHLAIVLGTASSSPYFVALAVR